jgi:hypothetical protein
VLFLLLGQSRKFGVEGMIGRQECLLSMEDRRIRAGSVVEAVDLARPERELDAAVESRVRVGVEIGISEVRDHSRWAVQR